MKDSQQFILKTGDTLKCIDGYSWVYVGYRITSVQTYEHHFSRYDFIPYNGPWTYEAVNMKTLYKKFPNHAFEVEK